MNKTASSNISAFFSFVGVLFHVVVVIIFVFDIVSTEELSLETSSNQVDIFSHTRQQPRTIVKHRFCGSGGRTNTVHIGGCEEYVLSFLFFKEKLPSTCLQISDFQKYTAFEAVREREKAAHFTCSLLFSGLVIDLIYIETSSARILTFSSMSTCQRCQCLA